MSATESKNLTLAGLESVVTTITTAGTYKLSGKISCPMQSPGGTANSAVVMTITQNVTVIYTGPAGAEGFETTANCAAGDTLTFALSSAAAIDQPLNACKATIAIG